MTAITANATIGISPYFPVEYFTVTNGVYGAVGHAQVHTSRKLLLALGIDLFALASSQQGYTEIDINIIVDGVVTRIFGGEYVNAKWDYDSDTVVISARDFSGILVDQKRILSSTAEGVKQILGAGQTKPLQAATVNTKLSSIIHAIGDAYGFQVQFNPAGSANLNLVNSEPDPTIGSLYGSDTQTFLSVPQTLWAILNQLARDTGYEVYVTSKKILVFGQTGFGPAGTQLPTMNLTYNVAPTSPAAGLGYALGPGTIAPVPCRGLSVEHNPRRNKTFRVLVLSYDPCKGQQVSGQAIALGTNQSGTTGNDYQPGVWGPSNYQAISQALEDDDIKIPLYTFHQDGLTQDQANYRALSIANDIKRRELILKATIDGNPNLYPTQPLMISGQVDSEVSGNLFYAGSYTHTFRMPRGNGGANAGFNTEISAWNIPEPGVGAPIKKTNKSVTS